MNLAIELLKAEYDYSIEHVLHYRHLAKEANNIKLWNRSTEYLNQARQYRDGIRKLEGYMTPVTPKTLPPVNVQVLGFAEEWKEKNNPTGKRVCYRDVERWYSAYLYHPVYEEDYPISPTHFQYL